MGLKLEPGRVLLVLKARKGSGVVVCGQERITCLQVDFFGGFDGDETFCGAC